MSYLRFLSLFPLEAICLVGGQQAKLGYFAECSGPIFLEWSNMTIREGSTALFKCPVDVSASCATDSIQWYKLNAMDGDQKLLEDSRIEVFSSDPLVM